MEVTNDIVSDDELKFQETKEVLGLSDQDIEDHKGDARAIWEKTYNKYKEANESEYSGRRWFWELVQNAIDALEDENDTIDVTLEIEDSHNGKTAFFTHNGGCFQNGNHIDDIDDFENFIRPGSSKQIGENQKGGRFGTGFLSTHCLSPVINVGGICLTTDGRKYWNEITLDRSEITEEKPLSIRISKLKITKQIIEYKINKRQNNYDIDGKSSASIAYKSPINEKNLNDGLKEIEHSLPYVNAFNPQLQTVTIIDNGFKTIYKNLRKTRVVNNHSIFETLVCKDGFPDNTYFLLLWKEDKFDLAWRISYDSQDRCVFLDERTNYQRDFEDNKSSLFCRYPLIGSGDFKFPIVINSKEFRPEEKRNGINLKEINPINKDLIQLGVESYRNFLISHKSVEKQFNIIDLFVKGGVGTLPEWVDKDWYKDRLDELKEIILEEGQLRVSPDTTISLGTAYIPYLPKDEYNEDILLRFFKLVKKFLPNQTPIEGEYLNWYNRIDFSILPSLKYDLKNLLNDIEKIGDLDTLSKHVDKPIEWLRDAILLIIEIDKDLLDHHSVISNQQGSFKQKNEDIFFNNGIELRKSDDSRGVLLDSYSLILNSEFEVFLLHEDFEDIQNILPQEKSRDQKYLIKTIDDAIEESEDRKDSKFIKALQLLFNWLDNQEDPELIKAFSYLSTHKPDLYFHTFSDDERDLAFTIVQSDKLESLSRLVSSNLSNEDINSMIEIEKSGIRMDQMSELAKLSKSAGIDKVLKSAKELAQENEERIFKQKIGEQVENILNDLFEKEFPNLRAKLERTIDYDIIIFNKEHSDRKYFIELKSIMEGNTEPIKMGIHQARKAKNNPNNYALLMIRRPQESNITEEYLRNSIICDYQIGKDVVSEVDKSKTVDEIVKSMDSIKLEIKDPTMKVHIRQDYIDQIGKDFEELKMKIYEAIK